MERSSIEEITAAYGEVFVTHPFPIHIPEYILKMFDEGVQYFGAEIEGKIVAFASADMDGKSAEMTD